MACFGHIASQLCHKNVECALCHRTSQRRRYKRKGRRRPFPRFHLFLFTNDLGCLKNCWAFASKSKFNLHSRGYNRASFVFLGVMADNLTPPKNYTSGPITGKCHLSRIRRYIFDDSIEWNRSLIQVNEMMIRMKSMWRMTVDGARWGGHRESYRDKLLIV